MDLCSFIFRYIFPFLDNFISFRSTYSQTFAINSLDVERNYDNEPEKFLTIHSTRKKSNSTESTYSRLGLDSHADMTCVGKDALIIEHVHGQTCTVHPFHDSYRPKTNVKVCNAAFAFDQDDGRTKILILNQCLDFSNTMEHSLLCTNQVRSNGIIVDDVPIVIDVLHCSSRR